jgi:uncharacterized protein YjbI with pentapeptide repeats
MNSFWAAALIGVLGLLILVLGYVDSHGYTAKYIISDFYGNFGEGFIGIAITVLIIDFLNMRREETELKKQLIRDLGSENNLFTLRAIRELRAHGHKKTNWLNDGTLHFSNLLGANLSDAPLEGASLLGVDLTGSNLSGVFFADAILKNAILLSADLTGANLECADLRGSNLSGAILRKANLLKANLAGANLDDVIFDDETKWPEGYHVPR